MMTFIKRVLEGARYIDKPKRRSSKTEKQKKKHLGRKKATWSTKKATKMQQNRNEIRFFPNNP